MKKVVFIRHAKSSWDDPYLKDVERPLNDRGERDAPKMAKYLKEHVALPDLVFLSSIAKRAKQTAMIFAKAFNIEKDQILLNEQLYYGNAEDYILALHDLVDSFQSCLIFGHNPIIEHVTSQIFNPYLGPAPTCSVFICQSDVKSWKEITVKELTLLEFAYPKML